MDEQVIGKDGKEKKKANPYLRIELSEKGVEVTGIVRHEPMAFWLLEKAKDLIKALNTEKTSKVIMPGTGFKNRVHGAFGKSGKK